jgi:phage/plasmid-associated DNA primase
MPHAAEALPESEEKIDELARLSAIQYDRQRKRARLRGVRLVTASETQQRRSWDEAKIKNLTGGDTLSGRFMNKDFFDFEPTHKLMINGNYKPNLRNVDEAIRRRLLLVPFTVQIPKEEKDLQLRSKLKKERPAILRWMLDGCLEWRDKGLMVPEIVRAASDEYFDDEDVTGQWLQDRTVADPDAFTTTTHLFGSWRQWCEPPEGRGCGGGRSSRGSGARLCTAGARTGASYREEHPADRVVFHDINAMGFTCCAEPAVSRWISQPPRSGVKSIVCSKPIAVR